MKEIVCTNCKESFSVEDEHFNSKKMVFNCKHCRVEIKRNEENGEWEATESLPVPEKPKKPSVFSIPYIDSPVKPRTLIDLVKVWRDRVVTISWLLAGYNFLLLFLVNEGFPIALAAVAFNILRALFIGYFIAFLMECLAKHLENQQDMIKLLKKDR